MTKARKDSKPLRVGLVSLGCAKNLVDAEIMLGSLLKDDVEITNDPETADALIVNTCSFIDSAQEESVDAILESSEVRAARNPGQALIVSGCLSQRYKDELPKLFPEVDGFMGIDQVADVSRIVREAIARRGDATSVAPQTSGKASRKSGAVTRFAEIDGKASAAAAPTVDITKRPVYIPDYATPRFRLTPKQFAYVKIAEGCNHPCSFCTIPRMRGGHRSRAQKDIVAEVRQLVREGVKEINLISQDSTYYGLDLRTERGGSIAAPDKFTAATRSLPADATTLCTLLRELNKIRGDFWIRLLYTHPAHWTDELIQTIAECRKVARYVDMPLQHIHPVMLERMRRETSGDYIVDLIRRIRAGVPGIALRTTFIVGFPGETEEYFEALLSFIRETEFERMGVFTYSREDGTRAAAMAKHVHHRTREKRRRLAMAEQHRIARKLSESRVGTTMKVLVEGAASAKELKQAKISSWEHGLIRETDESVDQLKGRYLVARGEADAPDIDGRVYIRGDAEIGNFAKVRIVGHTDYDLIAEPV